MFKAGRRLQARPECLNAAAMHKTELTGLQTPSRFGLMVGAVFNRDFVATFGIGRGYKLLPRQAA
jgi:hypothetical protein